MDKRRTVVGVLARVWSHESSSWLRSLLPPIRRQINSSTLLAASISTLQSNVFISVSTRYKNPVSCGSHFCDFGATCSSQGLQPHCVCEIDCRDPKYLPTVSSCLLDSSSPAVRKGHYWVTDLWTSRYTGSFKAIYPPLCQSFFGL